MCTLMSKDIKLKYGVRKKVILSGSADHGNDGDDKS